MSFCCLTNGITLKICRLCVCVIINKRSFESFMCLDLVVIMLRLRAMDMLEHYRHRSSSLSSEQHRYSDLASPRDAVPAPGKESAGLLCEHLLLDFLPPRSPLNQWRPSPCRTPLRTLNR